MSVPSQGIIKIGEEKIGDHLETVSNFINFFKSPWYFPGGPVVKISPCNAWGGDLNSGQGAKIPHALGLKNKTEAIW